MYYNCTETFDIRNFDRCCYNNYDNFHILGILPVYGYMENKVNEWMNTNPVTMCHIWELDSQLFTHLPWHHIQRTFIHITMRTSSHRAVFITCSDIFCNFLPNWDCLESLISCVLYQLYLQYLNNISILENHYSASNTQRIRWGPAVSLETMCVILVCVPQLDYMSDKKEWNIELHSEPVLLFFLLFIHSCCLLPIYVYLFIYLFLLSIDTY